jgi:hypothetical protein
MIAWCIMPNHVHALVEPRHPIAKIVQGWKSFTARWALARNEELQLGIPDSRHFWMREYWDRYIRHERHLIDVITYFHNNPVKAGLCRRPQDWPWSSAGIAVLGNAAPGNADVRVGSSGIANVTGNAAPGNADVRVGSSGNANVTGNADVRVGSSGIANVTENASVPVGKLQRRADGDVGVPGKGV